MTLQFGISVPNFGGYADPRALAELAHDAEQAGWDGFFVWDHMQYVFADREPVADPWILLAAIALRTERMRLGPLVTPVARRRPSKLARETVSLDQLSGGRLILGVGLGAPADAEFEDFGEDGDARIRAEKLDEGLAVLAGLWSGEPFSFSGTHFQVDDVTFLPPPIQQPRVPIWVAAQWPNRAPLRRAARWDGVAPGSAGVGWNAMMPADDLRAAVAYIHEQRTTTDTFDVVVRGISTGVDHSADADLVDAYREAGMTWWVEHLHGYRGPYEEMAARIRLGPPRAG